MRTSCLTQLHKPHQYKACRMGIWRIPNQFTTNGTWAFHLGSEVGLKTHCCDYLTLHLLAHVTSRSGGYHVQHIAAITNTSAYFLRPRGLPHYCYCHHPCHISCPGTQEPVHIHDPLLKLLEYEQGTWRAKNWPPETTDTNPSIHRPGT